MADEYEIITVPELPVATDITNLVVLGVSSGASVQVPIALLKGNKGDDGTEIELTNDGSYIKWRLVGASTWNNLVSISSLEGSDGISVEIQNNGTYIQWRPIGSATWNNIISIADISGIDGDDGKEVEFQNNGTYIQWRYVGDVSWNNLVALVDIKGNTGPQGKPLVVLSNGNYGNWDEATEQYVDSGVEAAATVDINNVDVIFTEAETKANINTGESVPTLFGKLKKWFSSFGSLAWKSSVDYGSEVTGKPTIPSTFDQLSDGDVNKAFTATEKTKLSDIAAGATANDTDTNLKNRANHTGEQAIETVTGLSDALSAKAPLASPALTGTPTAPTPVSTDNSTKLATTAFVKTLIDALVNASPGTLDTLDELAAALGDDPNFATTITALIGQKLAKASNLSDLTDAAAARTNLGLGAVALLNSIGINNVTDLQTALDGLNADLVQMESDVNALETNVDTIEQFLYSRNMYGVEFLKGASDPASIRWIGGEQFKTNHLILNKFKVAKVKDVAVVGFLNPTNWFKMEDGSASNIVIDGTIVTDDGSDIMLVNTEPFYVINGGTHATYERRLISDSPFTYDGDKAVYVAPFGMCVDFSVIKASKQRSIRDNSLIGTGGAGIGGVTYLADGKGCPTTSASRFNYELYARAKNTDNTKNVPYANAFQFDENVWATLLFIKFQTKDLHAQSRLGGCISSNDSAPDAGTWGTKSGVRVHNTDSSYSYYTFASSRFRATSEGSNTNFFNLINQYRPLLKMFDAQLALSYAKQNSIAADTEFIYDGFTWKYSNIAGHPGIADGDMTARVRKFVPVTFTGWDGINAVAVENMVIDYCFDQAIVNGKIAGWGNIWKWISGIDCVVDANNANLYTIYQTDDVEKLTTDTDVTEKDPGNKFTFENVYSKVGAHAYGSGYHSLLFNNSIVGKTIGTSLHTGECAYQNFAGTASAGKLARRGVFVGGYANFDFCALRIALANYAPTITITDIGGGFRVRLL